MNRHQGPIHIRSALFESLASLSRQHLTDYRELEKQIFGSGPFPEDADLQAARERACEIRGCIRGLRAVMWTLSNELSTDLAAVMKELEL